MKHPRHRCRLAQHLPVRIWQQLPDQRLTGPDGACRLPTGVRCAVLRQARLQVRVGRGKLATTSAGARPSPILSYRRAQNGP